MQYKMNSNSELELTGLNENHRFKSFQLLPIVTQGVKMVHM